MANKFGYALLAALTGPLGGGVAGYLYAQKENQLSVLQGRPEEKSLFFSSAIGVLFSPFSGAYYGWNLADAENRMDEYQRAVRSPRNDWSAQGIEARSMERSPSQQQWRETVRQQGEAFNRLR